MTEFVLDRRTRSILLRAPSECTEIVLGHPDRPGVPPREVNNRIFPILLAATPDEGRQHFTTSLDDQDVEHLVRMLPAVLGELADDPAECCARMDAWPEELEAAQAELLRALGR